MKRYIVDEWILYSLNEVVEELYYGAIGIQKGTIYGLRHVEGWERIWCTNNPNSIREEE
jgi:hypothetical protein